MPLIEIRLLRALDEAKNEATPPSRNTWRGCVYDGARDQIRTHWKHCFHTLTLARKCGTGFQRGLTIEPIMLGRFGQLWGKKVWTSHDLVDI